MGCPALELPVCWVELGLSVEMKISERAFAVWYYVEPGGLSWTNVLNSALPPQRLRPDTRPEHQYSVSHLSAGWLWIPQKALNEKVKSWAVFISLWNFNPGVDCLSSHLQMRSWIILWNSCLITISDLLFHSCGKTVLNWPLKLGIVMWLVSANDIGVKDYVSFAGWKLVKTSPLISSPNGRHSDTWYRLVRTM